MMPRAAACLMILTALCSGCARPEPAKSPLVILPAHCPRPAAPELPRLSGLALLESGQGYALLKRRDNIMRAYIAGLADALDCYEAQAAPAPKGEKEWTQR